MCQSCGTPIQPHLGLCLPQGTLVGPGSAAGTSEAEYWRSVAPGDLRPTGDSLGRPEADNADSRRSRAVAERGGPVQWSYSRGVNLAG